MLNFTKPMVNQNQVDSKTFRPPVQNSLPPSKIRRILRLEREALKTHETVISSRGVRIDKNIVSLIEVLWSLGFTTQFCCEGHSNAFDKTGVLDNGQWGAHIVFPDITEATEFLKYSYNHLMSEYSSFNWVNTMSLSPMLTTSGFTTVRAIVVFDPDAIEPLTKFWTAVKENSLKISEVSV